MTSADSPEPWKFDSFDNQKSDDVDSSGRTLRDYLSALKGWLLKEFDWGDDKVAEYAANQISARLEHFLCKQGRKSRYGYDLEFADLGIPALGPGAIPLKKILKHAKCLIADAKFVFGESRFSREAGLADLRILEDQLPTIEAQFKGRRVESSTGVVQLKEGDRLSKDYSISFKTLVVEINDVMIEANISKNIEATQKILMAAGFYEPPPKSVDKRKGLGAIPDRTKNLRTLLRDWRKQLGMPKPVARLLKATD